MNTNFNVIPMLVFLQKGTNTIEKIYHNQVVGIVTTVNIIDEIGITFPVNVIDETGITYPVNCGCDNEGKLLININTSDGKPIYNTDSPCHIFYEKLNNNEILIKINKEEFDVLEFNLENMPTNNPIIGWEYNTSQNKFFDPNPTVEGYVLNETTLEWEPDPEKTYNLHGDGKLYRYNPENASWWPTWESEPQE
jgi:hypothetical protein